MQWYTHHKEAPRGLPVPLAENHRELAKEAGSVAEYPTTKTTTVYTVYELVLD
jgi:hypothetical protein